MRRPAKGRPGRGKPTQRRARPEPDLMADVATALTEDEPLLLLSLVSSLLAALEPRRPGPLELAPEPDLPTRDELVRIFLGAPLVETSAILAVIAELSGDDITRRRIRREITERAH